MTEVFQLTQRGRRQRVRNSVVLLPGGPGWQETCSFQW